jgi:hypothetical protein
MLKWHFDNDEDLIILIPYLRDGTPSIDGQLIVELKDKIYRKERVILLRERSW